MPYLFDTESVAEVLRRVPDRGFVRRLSSVSSRDRWISVVTVSQLLMAARRTEQPKVMQDVVNLIASVRVATFDVSAAQTFAKLRASSGRQLETDDLMMAAIAQCGGYTLVTSRTSAFRGIPGLRTENWF